MKEGVLIAEIVGKNWKRNESDSIFHWKRKQICCKKRMRTKDLIHRRFDEVAKVFSDHFAVGTEDGLNHLSYSELEQRSNYLAKCLIVKAGSKLSENRFIGVLVNRGIGMVVALLAIMKTGAAYVPVDPSFPKDRQTYIFTHSKCSLLIVDEETQSEAITLAGPDSMDFPEVFQIEKNTGFPSEKISVRNNPPILLPLPTEDRSIAYVLYTSGSTGKPKGVMVYHDSVMNILDWFADDIGLTEDDHVLGLTTYCFDISVLEMFMPLTQGAGLIVTSSITQRDPFRIIEILQRMKITVMQATPTTFEMCLATGWTGDQKINFLVGGEAFRPKLKELVKNCRSMRNVYGPTGRTVALPHYYC